MNINSFLRALSAQILYKFPEVNQGGCGVVAAEVAHYLESMKGVLGITEVRVIVTPDYQASSLYAGEMLPNFDEWRPLLMKDNGYANLTLRAWQRRGFEFSHVYVAYLHGGVSYLFDAINLRVTGGANHLGAFGTIYGGSLTVTEMQYISRQRRGWNRSFDYSHGGRVVRRFIYSSFLKFARHYFPQVTVKPYRIHARTMRRVRLRSEALRRELFNVRRLLNSHPG